MKLRSLSVCFVALLFSCEAANKPPAQARETAREPVRGPVSIVLDTDIGPDVDDVGALAMLHALADRGEARILGVMSSNPNQWAAPAIDVVNTYFGRGDLPIGAPRNGGVVIANAYGWNEAIVPHYPHNLDRTDDATDAVVAYRKLLAAQPDRSVTLVTIGFLTNLKNLLASPQDALSSLGGKQLVAKKVKQLVVMGGKYPRGKEFNLEQDPEAAVAVVENWPTPILFSGSEVGEKVFTGSALVRDSTLANSPVREAFRFYLAKDQQPARPSWDQTAVLVAVRGHADYFNAVAGQCRMYRDGHNEWTPSPNGPHRYLTFKRPPAEIQAVVEDLMRHPPK
ncbi:MAG: nucleoside hydrolase [Ferruginibacter sp.]|nr:nucleoside hydrolase [Cytophagales bacterium]